MERIPQGKYTPEFWAEAVKLVATGLSIPEVGRRLNIPKAACTNGSGPSGKANLARSAKGSAHRLNTKWNLPAYAESWQKHGKSVIY